MNELPPKSWLINRAKIEDPSFPEFYAWSAETTIARELDQSPNRARFSMILSAIKLAADGVMRPMIESNKRCLADLHDARSALSVARDALEMVDEYGCARLGVHEDNKCPACAARAALAKIAALKPTLE